MKRIIAFIFLFLLSISAANAKSGDIIGRFYSTDIKTYLNGEEIDAINIGGQTLINAEVMHEYGFDVFWDDKDRTLSIYEKKTPFEITLEHISVQKAPTGTPIGYYYETDIVTYLENVPITAYNIGGQTYIHAESMNDFGYVVTWYSKERKLEVESPMNSGYVYNLNLMDGKEQTVDGKGHFSFRYQNGNLKIDGDEGYFNLGMHSTGRRYQFSMAFYQNLGLFYSVDLIDTLKTLCYDRYGIENPCDKSEKYDLVNKVIDISINGHKAEKVSVTSGAGNGHRDFYIFVEGLPNFKIDELEEIIFSISSDK